jgi:hypothetical protein
MKIAFIHNIGFILLAIYLILVGLTTFFIGFAIPGIIMGIIAFVAGILILLGI